MDNAATTELKDCAYETMKYALYKKWYNPSSPYEEARKCKNDLESCRCQIAELINADPSEIYFTSGGTESDNWALKGCQLSTGDNIIISAIEHDAIYRTAKEMEVYGIEVRIANPNSRGVIEEDAILSLIDDNTKMVSCMYINNELGTIQPIASLGAELRKRGIVFHTDAVQAFGHIPIDVMELKVDMLSVSAHKFGGPKGVGFLYIRNLTKLKKMVNGGHQESDMRAGTENLPAIMGMTAAAREAVKNLRDNYDKIEDMSLRFLSRLLTEIKDVTYNGSSVFYYPGIINVTFKGVPGEQLVEYLSQHQIYVSSGSACNTGLDIPSKVLTAIGKTSDEANSSIRFSLNENNTMEEASKVIEIVKKGVKLIRG